MAKHRVEFVQLARATLERIDGTPSRGSDIGEVSLSLRHEFVEWGVEQADCYRQPRHYLEQADKISALFREQLGEGHTPPFFILSQDHFAHRSNTRRIEKHMFCSTKTDALRAKIAGNPRVCRGFGIGANLHPARAIGPFHQRTEIARHFRLHGRDFARHDFARGPVDCERISLANFTQGRALPHTRNSGNGVDAERASTRHTRTPHAARHDGGMACHATARGQDPLGRVHAMDIFRRRFGPDKNDRLALFGTLFGAVAVEDCNA